MFRSRLVNAILFGLAVNVGVALPMFASSGFEVAELMKAWILGWVPGLFAASLYYRDGGWVQRQPDDDSD